MIRSAIFFLATLAGSDETVPDKVPLKVLYLGTPDTPRFDSHARILRDQFIQAFERHRKVLFFSEYGGSRWFVDHRALTLGVSTADLRGAARAHQSADAAGVR